MSRAFVLLTSGVVPLLAAIACGESAVSGRRDDVDSSVSAPPKGGVPDAADAAVECPAVPVSSGSPRCVACLAERCCDVFTACAANASCSPLLQCVVACQRKPDAGGCIDACIANDPDGEDGFLAVEQCWAGNFPESCTVSCSQ